MDKKELRQHRLIILESMKRHSCSEDNRQTLGSSLLSMTSYELEHHKNILKRTISKNPLSFQEYLAQLIKEKGYTRAKVCEESEIDSSHLTKYLTGKRNPNKDNLLRIILALKLSEEEALTLLNLNEMSLNEENDLRDATFAYCMQEGFSLHKTRELMIHMGVNPL